MGMKTYGDLSWAEKRAIARGKADPYKYHHGYSFDVKQKVAKGRKKK